MNWKARLNNPGFWTGIVGIAGMVGTILVSNGTINVDVEAWVQVGMAIVSVAFIGTGIAVDTSTSGFTDKE